MIKKIGRTFLLLSLGFGIGGLIGGFSSTLKPVDLRVPLMFFLIAVIALGFLMISEYIS